MNRNVESHFAKLPQANVQRSLLDLSSSHKTSFNAGDIIPFYVGEVLPGDTFDVTTAKVVRSQTLLTPIMDNMYLDTYWFFVPNRLCWKHWEEFCGENKSGPWAQTVDYTVPAISSPDNGTGKFESGTLADYMGYPIGTPWKATDALAPSALPFRAYALIINHFFRDQNFANPLLVPDDDANQTGSNAHSTGPDQDLSACANGGFPYKANKSHDYFTSALPAPQKGSPVDIPVSVAANISLPSLSVLPGPTAVSTDSATGTRTWPTSHGDDADSANSYFPLLWGSLTGVSESPISLADTSTSLQPYKLKPTSSTGNGLDYSAMSTLFALQYRGEGGNQQVVVRPVYPTATSNTFETSWVPLNLHTLPASISTGADGASFNVNQFRLAYVYQCYLEAIARSGSRYGEMIHQIFGVTNPDSRLQEPEYLGGNRVPISVNEITNTTQADKDFLGDVGAKSATSDVNHDFIKSFTEHGILMGLCVVRYDHSYCQGVPRWLTRKKYTDFYNPMFANLGEMPIYKAEIYAGGSTYSDKNPINDKSKTFGYQEAWADYRYCPARVSGEMRPGVQNSLAYWHLADNYDSEPTLSESWLMEDKANVDRVLAVTSSVSNQFWADIAWKIRATRCMPMYSIPGLEPKF